MTLRVDHITHELAGRACPTQAAAAARYMKTSMPFHGVRMPEVEAIVRDALRRWPLTDAIDYRRTVEDLWAQPCREERYAAIMVARRSTRFVSIDHLDLYRRLIIEGAWWDLVDGVAPIIGRLLLADRPTMRPVLDMWIDGDDLWLRRVALLSQLGAKDATDAEMLFDYCRRRAHEPEFFIRKAIGWALRQYARTAPDHVRAFCLANRELLSSLSYREAMKHLEPAPPAPERSENPRKP